MSERLDHGAAESVSRMYGGGDILCEYAGNLIACYLDSRATVARLEERVKELEEALRVDVAERDATIAELRRDRAGKSEFIADLCEEGQRDTLAAYEAIRERDALARENAELRADVIVLGACDRCDGEGSYPNEDCNEPETLECEDCSATGLVERARKWRPSAP